MAKPWHQKQKDRGVKLILGWFAPRKCWKKFRDGQTKYFRHPNSAAGYELAVAEYHAWLHQIRDNRTLAAEYRHHAQFFDRCCEWYDRFGTPVENGSFDQEGIRNEVFKFRDQLTTALQSGEDLTPIPSITPQGANLAEKQFISFVCVGPGGWIDDQYEAAAWDQRFGALGWEAPELWRERLRQLDCLESTGKKIPQTIGHQAQRFLGSKERQVHGGVIKPRTWGTLAERLPVFVAWAKPGTHVGTITGTTLTHFYEWLLTQDQWNHQVKLNYFKVARQWIRWAWRQDEVELETLPRNIDSKEFVFLVHIDEDGVSKKTRSEQLWKKSEFKTAMNQLPDDLKLFLLLMLNCGFTDVDVGTLLKREVNLDKGRIIRQRTKTRRHEHPPVVNYKLWPMTIELLRDQWSEHPTLALANRRNNPLYVSKLVSEAGKTKEVKWTSIGRRFTYYKNKKPKTKKEKKLPQKKLMFLRKTGSTKIKSLRKFMGLDSLYLGHSWANMADKHYNAFDGHIYKPLDEAIDWLGKEFDLVD